MSLKRILRTGVAAACIASVATPVGVQAQTGATQVRSRGPDVRVATAATFSRVEIGGPVTARRDGRVVILTFSPGADPDVARLRTSPPRWIESVTRRTVGGRLELAMTLAEGADARIGRADGATFVNVFEPAEPEAQAEGAEAPASQPAVEVAEAEPERPNPLPASGVVPVQAKIAGGQVQLSFAFANPAGAAVFRRGDAVWVVFDAPAKLDVSKAPRGVASVRSVQATTGPDHAAVRIDALSDAPIFVTSQGSTWTVSVGPGGQPQPTIVQVARDAAAGPATLRAPLAGATRVINMPDPVVGDTLKVVTALGPPKGLPTRREFVELALLPSIQGLAVEPRVEDLDVRRDGELVTMTRADGLSLSPAWASQERRATSLGAPERAAMPALIHSDWSRTGEGGFLPRYNALVASAASEGAAGDRNAPTEARMALARFLVGSELSFEAIGVLNALGRSSPAMLDDPEFRGLRGIARTFARRYAEADTDFAAPALVEDPSAALWRAYLAAQLGQFTETRTQFSKGAEALALMSSLWRARIARADAQAAVAMGDLVGAESRIRMALQEEVSPEEQLHGRLVQARIAELQGAQDRALRIYDAIAKAPSDAVAAPATLRATQIRLARGKVTPVQAAGIYDTLRYRWRGDSTELETIRALGSLYLGQGRYREALEALRSAGVRLPDLPEAVQLQADLNTAFRALFLDGLADGLEPTQALALFFDFRELAPLGADGDLMVRKIVRRLVDVDLLPQAAELLKYQAENRLDGVARSQVSTDLAVIYLMDRKPEQALQAINASRTTVLPTALSSERRLVEARAWTALGKFDSALEIIERDQGRDATELRAEITWKSKDWAAAGPLFERALGDRWKTATPLSSEEEGRLLRAGVAYSLAGDEPALARLQQRFGGFHEKANNPEALKIALSGLPDGRLSVADFGRVAADNEVFAGWVQKMKGRFKTRPAPTAAPKGTPPARQAQGPAAPARG